MVHSIYTYVYNDNNFLSMFRYYYYAQGMVHLQLHPSSSTHCAYEVTLIH